MPRRSWVLLLGAIVVATVTVSVIAAFGPEWPDTFADCDGEESVQGGGAPRIRAIAAWKDWFAEPFTVGLVVSGALLIGWAVTAGWRPRRRTVAILVALVVVVAVAIALQPLVAVLALALFAFGWSYLLDFPDLTALIAPVLCLVTLGFAAGTMRLGRGGQRIAQIALALLLITAWASLALAGFPAKGSFAC
jgi:hypothetical protein